MVITTAKVVSEIVQTPFRVIISLIQRFSKPKGKPQLFLFGFNDWKTFMYDWFPEREVIFTPMNMWPIDFDINWKWRLLSDPRAEVLAWQYKVPPKVKAFCKRRKIPFRYVEDGFIRSFALGALKTPPMSMTFDSQDMYFNATAPTDLEHILSTHDFDADETLMSRASIVLEQLLQSKISKYNSGGNFNPEEVFGVKDRKRILVIGQVERDASIEYGCNKKYSNNDLVWMAARENPSAQIIYKPHPEVLQGTAPAISNPDAVRGAALVLDSDVSLSDALATADHVYTLTSLAGFEALLRGIKVTTFGCPFYAGWGLTDDRQPNERRTRKLTTLQVFAAAYILYPKYFDPISKSHIEIEEALTLLAHMRERQPPIKENVVEPDIIDQLAERVAIRLAQKEKS